MSAAALPFPVVLPPGYGVTLLPRGWHLSRPQEDLFGHLLIWEPPRADAIYVLSADVADGIGQDRSCAEVTRLGTVREPEEQVAQFISPFVDPIDFAHVLDSIGRLYRGSDSQPAVCAVEVNNHGIATQSELMRHLGYSNLYVWQYEDARPDRNPLTTRVGFQTNRYTRPLILARYVKKVKGYDPATGVPDYRINSPFTVQELRTFRTLETLAEAEADPTNPEAHDDCIMTGAIGIYVCHTLQREATGETVADTRKRLSERRRREGLIALEQERPHDFRNLDYTVEEMQAGAFFVEEDLDV